MVSYSALQSACYLINSKRREVPNTEAVHQLYIIAFMYHTTQIWHWEKKEYILTSGSEINS